MTYLKKFENDIITIEKNRYDKFVFDLHFDILKIMKMNTLTKTKKIVIKQIIQIQNNFYLTIIKKINVQMNDKLQTNRKNIFQNKNNKKNLTKIDNFLTNSNKTKTIKTNRRINVEIITNENIIDTTKSII